MFYLFSDQFLILFIIYFYNKAIFYYDLHIRCYKYSVFLSIYFLFYFIFSN